VRYQSVIISSALFLTYGKKLHYHFGNSDPQYVRYAPNNLLMHTVAEWGIEHGFEKMYLGGGRTASPDDTLLRFKLVISPHLVPYWLGRQIYNPDVYDSLCEAWLKKNGKNELPPYSFPYRLT
jgi:lipid II:glycine glycyltransferase (peptidoglycan interpeptide bridge formation enzyme)